MNVRDNAVEFNERFVLYAASNGRSAEDQLEHDRRQYVDMGGLCVGFILWMNDMKAQARELHPEWFIGQYLFDFHSYKQWLKHRVGAR